MVLELPGVPDLRAVVVFQRPAVAAGEALAVRDKALRVVLLAPLVLVVVVQVAKAMVAAIPAAAPVAPTTDKLLLFRLLGAAAVVVVEVAYPTPQGRVIQVTQVLLVVRRRAP